MGGEQGADLVVRQVTARRAPQCGHATIALFILPLHASHEITAIP